MRQIFSKTAPHPSRFAICCLDPPPNWPELRGLQYNATVYIVISVIETFGNQATQDFYEGTQSKKAVALLPANLVERAQDLLDQLNAVAMLGSLAIPPSNRLHKLKGTMKEFWSISINKSYRIQFKWENGHAREVEITNHYGD